MRSPPIFNFYITTKRQNKEKVSIPVRGKSLTTVLTGQFGNPLIQTYNFQNVDVIVLEEIFLLRRELRHNYDLSFWIECSFVTDLKTALNRNQEDLSAEQLIVPISMILR